MRELRKCHHHPLRSQYGAPVIIENPCLFFRIIPSTLPPPLLTQIQPLPFLSFPFLSFHSLPSSIDIDISSSLCSKPLLQTSTSLPLFASTALKQFFTVTAFSNSAGEKKKKKQQLRGKPDEPDRRDTVERKKEKEKSLKKRKREAREKIEESVKVRRVKDEEKKILKRKE